MKQDIIYSTVSVVQDFILIAATFDNMESQGMRNQLSNQFKILRIGVSPINFKSPNKFKFNSKYQLIQNWAKIQISQNHQHQFKFNHEFKIQNSNPKYPSTASALPE